MNISSARRVKIHILAFVRRYKDECNRTSRIFAGSAGRHGVGHGQKEGKVWKAVVSVLEEFAESITDLEQQNAALSEELDDIYEELSVIEENFLDDDDDEFFDE